MLSAMTSLTLIHVALSLIGILSGLIVAFGLLAAKRFNGWTALFLVTTVLTSVTGFLFPFHQFLPSHALGILSLIALAIAIVARYPRQLAGGWRLTYVITAMLSLYFNVFVLVVQLFMKVPSLHALAPTQTEPVFKLTQLVLLVAFVILTILAAINFRTEPAAAAEAVPQDVPVESKVLEKAGQRQR